MATEDDPAGAVASPAVPQAPRPDQPLEGMAKDYLANLLENIALMLRYASDNGVALPADLRGKVDDLLQDPEVGKLSVALPAGY